LNPNPDRNGLPYDLWAFDLDGTVLRRDLGISDRTTAAMHRLRERGMRLVVATGRRFEGAREHPERLGFAGSDPLICYGGSMVRRMNGETLLRRTLSRDVSAEAVRWAAERGLHARVFLDGHIVTSPDNPATEDYLRRGEPNVSVVDSPAEWLKDSGEEPIKLVIVDHPDEVPRWLEEAREAFRGRLFVTRSLPHYVEIGGLAGTKSRALRFLCGHWGVDPARAIAFGDADNDVDMLRYVGHGVAVGGLTAEVREAADDVVPPVEVREAADDVVPPVEEDGVASYLERLLGESGGS